MGEVYRSAPPSAPDLPRDVTPEVLRGAANHGRFLRMFGAIWMGVGGLLMLPLGALATVVPAAIGGFCLTAAMAITGLLLYLRGKRSQSAALEVYKNGTEAEGEVVEVRLVKQTTLNNVHPWDVRYAYMVGRDVREGVARFWDGVEPRVSPGDPVAVLHMPGEPSRSMLWTELGKVDDAKRARPSARRRRRVEVLEEAVKPRIAVEPDGELSSPEPEEAETSANEDAARVAR